MSTRSTAVKAACAAIGLLLMIGCQSLEECAKETFSREFSCPQERVTVRERKDVDVYDAMFGPGPQPPDEVKKDPGRNALWQKEHSGDRAKWNEMMTIYEGKGCDHTSLYACNHPSGGPQNGSAPHSNCTKVTHGPETP